MRPAVNMIKLVLISVSNVSVLHSWDDKCQLLQTALLTCAFAVRLCLAHVAVTATCQNIPHQHLAPFDSC